MKRRAFLCGSVAALARPLTVEALQAGKVHRLGYVSPAPGPNPLTLAFERALRDAGLVDGQNVIVDRRFMGGREDQYLAVLAELERTVDVIVAGGPPAALAAKKVVTKVPVIFAAVGDPVAIGLFQSLAKPGGNLTGVAFDASPEIASKRLDLLRDISPTLRRVAALWSSTDPVGVPALRQLDVSAPRLGVTVRPFDVRGLDDFDPVFRQIAAQRFEGLLVVGGPVNVVHRKRIIDFASIHRLPAISISKDYVESGGLMSYGPNLADNVAQAVRYVEKILKGAKPADLPVEQPTQFELVINLKTAKTLGLTIPPSLLGRADQVIE